MKHLLWLILVIGTVTACATRHETVTPTIAPSIAPGPTTKTPTPNLTKTAWAAQSQTAAPIATSIAKVNLTSSARATIRALTPSITPPPTFAPISLGSPTPTGQPLHFTTPAPDVRFHQLKTWTDQDALASIREAAAYASAFSDFVNHVDVARRYLIIVARESLLRFPDSLHRDEIQWLLAYYQAIGFDFYPSVFSVGGFISALESDLNSGKIALSNLDPHLRSKGLAVVNRISVPNLYNDGQSVELIQVATDTWLFRKMVTFAVRSNKSKYQLIPIRDHWLYIDPLNGGDESLLVSEYRGIPSIISFLVVTGHAGCFTLVSEYQWGETETGGQFRNITQETGILDSIKSLPASDRGLSLCNDGSERDFWYAEYDFEPTGWSYSNELRNLHLAEDMLFVEQNTQGAIDILQPLLNAEVSAGYQYDFATSTRYLLAVAYELAGDTDQATQFYWQLWHAYPNSPYTLIIQRKLEQADP